MKKVILITALLFISITNAQRWGNKKIKGNGNKISVTRTTTEYDEISVAGPFSVELFSGKEGTIAIKGDENLMDYIKTEIKGNKLTIYLDNEVSYRVGGNSIEIKIPFEKISKLTFVGSGEIKTNDEINAEHFEFTFGGSGDGNIEVNATKLKAELAGSGDVKIKGITAELIANLAGSGNLNCSKMEAQNAKVAVSGSGDLTVNAIQSLGAKVAGSGDIHYKNNPQTLDKSVVGSGDITSY